MITVVGKIDSEDLSRYRMVWAMFTALENAGHAFDKDSAYKAAFDHARLVGELTDKYNLPILCDIDPSTGICTTEYEFDPEG